MWPVSRRRRTRKATRSAMPRSGVARASGWAAEGERVARGPEEKAEGRVEPLAEEVAADGPAVLRVRITPAMARAFAQRALQIVAAGRPPCPLCGLPLDAQGHVCPRQNGHRPGPVA